MTKTKEKIKIEWRHIPSRPVAEVQFTPQYKIGERFVAILPKNLIHKKTGITVNTEPGLGVYRCWFVVWGTNVNNITYTYRYNAGVGGNTRETPYNKSSIGPSGSKKWVQDYINKNYTLGEEQNDATL